MRVRAAVLRGVGEEWEVTTVDLDPPRAGEVLVRMAVAGICHSDDHYATGDSVASPELAERMRRVGVDVPNWFPLLGGHEGAGVVEELGPGVTTLALGDHVATSFTPSCGRCRWCVSGQSALCDVGAKLFAKEMVTDGTPRRHVDGVPLMAMTQLGTFAEYVVAAEASLVAVDRDVPFEAAALASCGVTTGWGSAVERAGTRPGDTVVVIGVGGVGMSAVQGARRAGARHVVAVDPVDFKRDVAPRFGATTTSASAGEAIGVVAELTGGTMADRVLITAGVVHVDLIQTAMLLTRKGGTCVVTGVTPLAEGQVPLILADVVNSAKELKGTLFGGMNPRRDIPRLLELYRAGELEIDDLITRRYRLDDINRGIRDLRAGCNIRGVVDLR